MSTYDPQSKPRYTDPLFWRDWAERVFWTLAQAALALVAVDGFDLPLWLVPIVASALAAVKGYVARQVGKRGSASTAPGV